MAEVIFSKFDHISIIVKDLDKAIEYYQSLGIGPFEPPKPVERSERQWLGKPLDLSTVKTALKIADIGPIRIELKQPIEGESLEKEFLETRGEGIDHIGFVVDDIDKAEAELVGKGQKLFYRARYKNGGGASYFDTREIGGFWTELLQWPEGQSSQIR